ncbi:phosphopantetheine-binding protein [Streptomyces mirabilis]|uniref:phosphopantetheine-binding protein n=1 Tax=Streptomyces mirabilis TaxID=68239 RepID=UPI0036C70305
MRGWSGEERRRPWGHITAIDSFDTVSFETKCGSVCRGPAASRRHGSTGPGIGHHPWGTRPRRVIGAPGQGLEWCSSGSRRPLRIPSPGSWQGFAKPSFCSRCRRSEPRLSGQKPPDRLAPSARTALTALPRGTGGSGDGDGGAEHAAPPASGAEPPGTPLQEIARDLFAEAIGVPRRTVHADSDFFRLGGHPTAAARLLARARLVLGAGLDDRALHEAPAPARFAAAAGRSPAAATGPAGALGGTLDGEGSAVLPLRLRGALNAGALQEALGDVGRRHGALRNSRLGSAGTRLRALAAGDHLLELTLPADLVDLWSHTPLAAELALAYRARATGRPPRGEGPVPEAAPRARAGDLAPTVPPCRRPAPADARVGLLALDRDAGLHQRLARLAATRGATLFMVVHAALAALLTRLRRGPRHHRGRAGAGPWAPTGGCWPCPWTPPATRPSPRCCAGYAPRTSPPTAPAPRRWPGPAASR